MDVVSACPLRVASLLWQPRAGIHVLTVVAKATYQLAPGVSPLAERQDDPSEYDNHWNDDPTRSLYAPTDLVPFKPRADVVLVGSAFAPRGTTSRVLSARLVVAGMDKSVEVWTERTLGTDGVLREAAPFTKVALRYERAAASPENPVGIRLEPRPDRGGSITLPNLQPPGFRATGREPIPSIGFGPIAPSWPTRISKLPRHVSALLPGWTREPMPEGLDPGYFNVAPVDQQVERLRPDELIYLENLHPQHPQLTTQLAGIHPRVTVQRGGAPEDLHMNADTLWIDTDRGVCSLTWRVQLRLERPDVAGLVQVSMLQLTAGLPSAATSEHDYEFMTADDAHLGEMVEACPIIQEHEEDDVDEVGTAMQPLMASGPALPFVAAPPGAPESRPAWRPAPKAPEPSRGEEVGETIIVRGHQPKAPTLPFAQVPEPSAMAAPAAPSAPSPQDGLSSPAYMWAPPSPEAPPPAPNPYAAPAPPPMTIGQAAMNAPAPAAFAPPTAGPEPMKPLVSSIAFAEASSGAAGAAPRIGSVSSLRDAGYIPGMPPPSAGAASNAAADPRAPAGAGSAEPLPSMRPRTPVELLWYDHSFIAKIRKEPAFSAALKERDRIAEARRREEKRPPAKPAPPAAGQPNPQDREDIATILSSGASAGVEGLAMIIADAVDERGTFQAPLVLMGGDIEFPFDEVETLKATVAAVTPLAVGDPKLKELIDSIGGLMRTPWLQAAGSVTERLTNQIKEVFASGNRLMPAGYLETHTERILLEQRHYQRRNLLGQVWIRALLSSPGSSAKAPVYLPDSLARALPMFQRFPVRLIAEARAQVDQYEAHPTALRAVALGRVLGATSRR